jgi:hypothetical protein
MLSLLKINTVDSWRTFIFLPSLGKRRAGYEKCGTGEKSGGDG